MKVNGLASQTYPEVWRPECGAPCTSRQLQQAGRAPQGWPLCQGSALPAFTTGHEGDGEWSWH